MDESVKNSQIGLPTEDNSMAKHYPDFNNEKDTDYLVLDEEFEPELTSERKEKHCLDVQKEIGCDSIEDKLAISDNKEDELGTEKEASNVTQQVNTPSNGDEQENVNGYSYSVMYFNHAGEATFTTDNVRTTQVEGSTVIHTADYASNYNPYSYEKPLKKRSIKFMKAIAIVAILFFFPTGICAYHYARKADIEFDVGIERGNIDQARKYVKKSEKFIIFSFFSAFIVAIIALAIFERIHLGPEELPRHGYHHFIAG